MSPPKLAGKVKALCQISILQLSSPCSPPLSRQRALFPLKATEKWTLWTMIHPYSFLSKMDLHHPMHWAELWNLMAQHRWSEPGPHSSNVGIPTGGYPALCRRYMNKHTSNSIHFTLRSGGGGINMLSICLCCLVQWSQTIQKRI